MATQEPFTPSSRGSLFSFRRRNTNSSVQSGTSMFSRMSRTNKERRKGEVIVFDPQEQQLWCQDKEKLKRLKGSAPYLRLPIPGNSLEVSVFMEQPLNTRCANNPTTSTVGKMAPRSSDTYKVFVADVNLGKMGDWVKHQRKRNKMQYIYVLGLNVVGFPPVIEDDGEDDE